MYTTHCFSRKLEAVRLRPISNLNNVSNILERLILNSIKNHISSSNFNPFQLAYRKHYTTKTAILLALDNIYNSIDLGSLTLLVSLDLSPAFDTIDHSILLSILHTSFGISALPSSASVPTCHVAVSLSAFILQSQPRQPAVRVYSKVPSSVLSSFPFHPSPK